MARLVYEVPDEATLIFRIFADDVPIFLESSLRISHRMCVFTLDQRLLDISFTIFDTVLITIVHRAENICEFAGTCLLILYGTGLVLIFNPCITFFEIRSHTGLIA